MNYIKQLQNELLEVNAELAGLKSGLIDLERYLLSDKFFNDPTVQIQDVLNRIADARKAGVDLSFEQASFTESRKQKKQP